MNKYKTLPGTILNFGPEIGYSITNLGAETIVSITMHSFGPFKNKNTNKLNRHKDHYIRIHGIDNNGGVKELHTSNVIRSFKSLKKLHRKATRKLGEFLTIK